MFVFKSVVGTSKGGVLLVGFVIGLHWPRFRDFDVNVDVVSKFTSSSHSLSWKFDDLWLFSIVNSKCQDERSLSVHKAFLLFRCDMRLRADAEK